MSEYNTEYNQRKQQESLMAKVEETRKAINQMISDANEGREDHDAIWYMDYLEKLVRVCGGESKLTFLDVGRDFIKAESRVPMSANLYQFMPETPENPRFHKVITKVLLSSSKVKSVRWIPTPERSSIMLVTLN